MATPLSLTKISIKDSSSWYTFLNLIYPIGSLYFSNNSTSPATRFGGTWSALHADSANSARYLKLGPWSTGGDNTIKVENMPSHTHIPSRRAIVQANSGLGNAELLAGSTMATYGWLVDNGKATGVTASQATGGQGFLPLLPFCLLLVSHSLVSKVVV